jgi:hypothetical protein
LAAIPVALIGAISFACSEGITDPLAASSSIPFPDSLRVSQGLPPLALDSTARIVGDAVIYASLWTNDASSQQAMQVSVRVTVYDTSVSARRRNLPIGTCPVSLRIYRGTDRSAPPVWQSDKAPPAVGCPTLRSFDQSATDVQATWDVAAMLGDSLPAGRYSFGYTLRTTDGRTFEFSKPSAFLSTDHIPPTTDLSAVHFEAHSEIVGAGPRMLKTVVVAKNTGTRTVRLNYGYCNLNVSLYRTPDRAGLPAWRSDRRNIVCPAAEIIVMLRPGESNPFELSVPMYEIVAGGLPAGLYLVSAELSLSGSHLLWAGVVDVTRAPERLPSSGNVDGLTFTATTRLVQGTGGADTIRTLVLVTNTTNTRRTASIPRDCPIVVYAYTSPAVRDAVPVQTSISYAGTKGCFGNSQTYYALDPGQSWVFGLDVPASAAAGGQHLWFTAWMAGTPSVFLAAGDVEVPR